MRCRRCAGHCGRVLARSKFSKTQWLKGVGSSRCPDCISGKCRPLTSYTASRYQNSNLPPVDVNDRVFVKMPCGERKLAVIVATTKKRVDVLFDSNNQHRVLTLRRSSIMDPTSKHNDNTHLPFVAASADSTTTTSDVSLVSHSHGRNRRAERGIVKKNLQRAIKYGRKEAARPELDGRPR